MAKKVIQMYDKYKSTTKIYPKVIKECFQDDAQEYIEGQVEANPEIAGTEADLESIKIRNTKYKVGGGKQLYQHFVKWSGSGAQTISFNYIDDSPTPMDRNIFPTWLTNNGFNSSKPYPCCGCNSNEKLYIGFYFDGNYWQAVKADGTIEQVIQTSWDFYNTIAL